MSEQLISKDKTYRTRDGREVWQPIETAPKDQELLVARRDGGIVVAKVVGWEKKIGRMNVDFGNASCTIFFPISDDFNADDAPTHWMPLPKPPKGEGL